MEVVVSDLSTAAANGDGGDGGDAKTSHHAIVVSEDSYPAAAARDGTSAGGGGGGATRRLSTQPLRESIVPPGSSRRLPAWLQESIGPWAIALPINMGTWGIAPTITNLAAASAGCSCDPSNDAVNTTYNVVVSFGFTAMPLAALLSYLKPCHSMHVLQCLAAVQVACFALLLSGATGAGFMSCSVGASATLAIAVFAMRAFDTYVTAMLYRVVATRCRNRPGLTSADVEKATLAFGQLLVAATLTATLLGVLLVDHGVLACRMGGGEDEQGSAVLNNASSSDAAEGSTASDCFL